ncbi:MAG: hypothetical protein AAFR46_04860 [Pseudomonadota bacterium]
MTVFSSAIYQLVFRTFSLLTCVLVVTFSQTGTAQSWTRETVLDAAFDVRAGNLDMSIFIRCGSNLEQSFIEIIVGQDSQPGIHVLRVDGGTPHQYLVPSNGYFVVEDAEDRALFAALIADLRRGFSLTVQMPGGRIISGFSLTGSSAALAGCSSG